MKLALFDCDGTLADSHGFLTQSLHDAFRHVGADLPPPALLREFYSLPFNEFFKRCEGHLTPEQITTASEFMMDHLISQRNTGALLEPFYPGIHAQLEALVAAGYLLGVVTNKGGHGLQCVLKTNKAEALFTTLQHANNARTKPYPEMVLKALAETGVEAADCVVVGDSVIDLHTARNAGVKSIAVTWAGRDAGPLAELGPRAIIDQIDQLAATVQKVLA